MKKCSRCATEKDLDCFYRQSASHDGRQAYCKQCNTQYIRKMRSDNPEPHRAAVKKWIGENTQKHSQYCAAWAAKNKEKVLESGRKSARKYPHKVVEKVIRRRRARGKATPAWANRFFIAEIYHLARLRTKATGVSHHVDHIVPLRGKLVCGLHVENNLRVIPGKENLSKGISHAP